MKFVLINTCSVLVLLLLYVFGNQSQLVFSNSVSSKYQIFLKSNFCQDVSPEELSDADNIDKKSVNIPLGLRFYLSCCPDDCLQKDYGNWFWMKPDGEIVHGPSIGLLVFFDSKLKDIRTNGTYYCMRNGQTVARTHLNFIEPKYNAIVKFIRMESIIEYTSINLTIPLLPNIVGQWLTPRSEFIGNLLSYNFIVHLSNTSTTLEIKKLTAKIAGNYTYKTCDGFLETKIEVSVFTPEIPIIEIKDYHYVQDGFAVNISCRSIGMLDTEFTWYFVPCKLHRERQMCTEPKCCSFNKVIALNNSNSKDNIFNSKVTTRKLDKNNRISYLDFIPSGSGCLKCTVKNLMGSITRATSIIVGDISKPFGIMGHDEFDYSKNNIIECMVGESFIFRCIASKTMYFDSIDWYKNDKILWNKFDEQRIVTGFRLQAWRKTLQFKKITVKNNGTYECRAENRYRDTIDTVRFTLLVIEKPDRADENISYAYYYVGGGVGIFVAILIIVLIFLYLKKKNLRFH